MRGEGWLSSTEKTGLLCSRSRHGEFGGGETTSSLTMKIMMTMVTKSASCCKNNSWSPGMPSGRLRPRRIDSSKTINLTWNMPPEGWFAVNIDGSIAPGGEARGDP
nr:hypothetical protein Itr_chr07CG00090 [Ipomoea trifida]